MYAESFAVRLSLMIACLGVSTCAPTSIRTLSPSNAPPDISHRMPAPDSPTHQGLSIGGYTYFGYAIVAPAEGVVVLSRGNHIRIHHGVDSSRQDVHTEHFHVDGRLPKEGDQVGRGENIGSIGRGHYSKLPHYHCLVVKKEKDGNFIALRPSDYWFGIDEHKEKLEKGVATGPFVIPCFDPNVNYPKARLRFTYPLRCK